MRVREPADIDVLIISVYVGVISLICRGSATQGSNDSLHVEFHVRSGLNDDDAAHLEQPLNNPWDNLHAPHALLVSRRAIIHHVVLRIANVSKVPDRFTDGWDSVTAVDKTLSHLPDLQTVILETPSDARTSDDAAKKLTLLRGAGRLRQRTYAEAQALALEARKLENRNTSGQLAPVVPNTNVVSPFWYSEHTNPLNYSTAVLRNVEAMLVSDVF